MRWRRKKSCTSKWKRRQTVNNRHRPIERASKRANKTPNDSWSESVKMRQYTLLLIRCAEAHHIDTWAITPEHISFSIYVCTPQNAYNQRWITIHLFSIVPNGFCNIFFFSPLLLHLLLRLLCPFFESCTTHGKWIKRKQKAIIKKRNT